MVKPLWVLGGRAGPVPASSGDTVRHRLAPGGDRRRNRALHTAAVTRTVHDPATRDHAQRRTDGEIHRCRKHHLARRTHRRLRDET